jgi:acetyl esterase/lipase
MPITPAWQHEDMRRILLATMAVAVVAAGCTSSSKSVSAPPTTTCDGTRTHRDLAYGTDPAQQLDLSVPCHPTALVVYVHGGSFVTGDKANRIDNKVKLFTDAGYAFASVDYRLSGKYPEAETDVADAIGYLAKHASEYGYDPHRILLLGHSAGAYLVSRVSTDPSFLTAAGIPLSDVKCTVSLDTDYDQPAGTTRGSPTGDLKRDKDLPKFRIVTRGSRARIAQAEAFAAKLPAAEVQNANPLTHEQVNQAVGAPGDTVITPPIMQMYASCR